MHKSLSYLIFSLLGFGLTACQLTAGLLPTMSPTPSPTPSTYSKVVTGGYSTCALRTDGKLACWGQYQDNTNTNLYYPAPTLVDEHNHYQDVALRANGATPHICAITDAGTLKCWGNNDTGQLGDGTTTERLTPTIIDSGTHYTTVSVNNCGGTFCGGHTCGITTSGILKCWGRNHLGNGSYETQTSPVVVDSGTQYQAVTAGHTYTCGITTTGILKCWGYSNYGMFGLGAGGVEQPFPTTVDAGTQYRLIAAHYAMICGITTAGVLKCWGTGYLGNGPFSTQTSPIVIDSGTLYQTVSAGDGAICGTTTTKVLKCWGVNYFGEIGNGTLTPQISPAVTDPGQLYVSTVTGGGKTCAITNLGFLKCWGFNSVGQLGDGTYNNSALPVSVVR